MQFACLFPFFTCRGPSFAKKHHPKITFIVALIVSAVFNCRAVLDFDDGFPFPVPPSWGEYFILVSHALLGQGGSGTVYKVGVSCPPEYQRVDIALKIAQTHIDGDNSYGSYGSEGEEAEEIDLHREYDFLRALSGTGIAIEAFGYRNETIEYIAMELVETGSLWDMIEAFTPLSISFADLTRQLIHAVRTLHKLSIVHRDIKPHNILLDRDGRILLADFDLACNVSDTACVGQTEAGSQGYRDQELDHQQQFQEFNDAFSTGRALAVTICPDVSKRQMGKATWLRDCLKHVGNTTENKLLLEEVVFPLMEPTPNRITLDDALQKLAPIQTALPQARQSNEYQEKTKCLRQ